MVCFVGRRHTGLRAVTGRSTRKARAGLGAGVRCSARGCVADAHLPLTLATRDLHQVVASGGFHCIKVANTSSMPGSSPTTCSRRGLLICRPVKTVRLSDLFSGPGRDLVYHFMYGKKQTRPCPTCTMWIDGFNGVLRHVGQNVDSRSSLPRICPRSERTRGTGGGRTCACSVPDPATSSVTSPARTPKATRIRRCPCSQRRLGAPLLGAPQDVRRHRPARYRSAQPRMARSRPRHPRPGRLVRRPHLLGNDLGSNYSIRWRNSSWGRAGWKSHPW